MLALPWKGMLTQPHVPLRSDSGSCSHSLCCQTTLSTAWQEQAAFPLRAQAWQILRCSTAQHSSSVMRLSSYRVTRTLRMLSLNHSLSPALPQPFSTTFYISLIFHFIFPYFILLSWLESHHLASFPVFQQTLPWSSVFLPPSQSFRSKRVTYFTQSFGLRHWAKDFKGMSNKTSFPIKKAEQMFIKKKEKIVS